MRWQDGLKSMLQRLLSDRLLFVNTFSCCSLLTLGDYLQQRIERHYLAKDIGHDWHRSGITRVLQGCYTKLVGFAQLSVRLAIVYFLNNFNLQYFLTDNF